MQASMRVRHITSGNLIYACYPKCHGEDRFDVMSRKRLRAILDGRERYAMSAQPDALWSRRAGLSEWQRILWCLNTAENNVSAFLHARMLRAYLVACGYDVVDAELEFGEAVQAHVEAVDYHEVPDVGVAEREVLRQDISQGVASAEGKLRYLKSTFKTKIVQDADGMEPALIRDMFTTYTRNQLGVQARLVNHRSERQGQADELSLFQDNRQQKGETVRWMCGLLGVEHAFAIGVQIERSLLERSAARVLEVKAELQQVFNLRVRESAANRETLRRGLDVINQVLRKHGFTEVVPDAAGRKRRRDRGALREVGGYRLEEQPAFKGYARHGRGLGAS